MHRPSRPVASPIAALVLGGLLLAPLTAFGQSPDDEGAPSPGDIERALGRRTRSGTVTVDIDELRRQLRDELRTTLRRELKEELRLDLEDSRGPPREPALAPLEDDGAIEEGWKWEEPVRPELNLLQLDGYFRLRYDFFSRLDLGTYYNRGSSGGQQLEQGPFVPGFSPPTAACNTDVQDRGFGQEGDDGFRAPAQSCFNRRGDNDNLSSANLRFRFEPTLNVSEDVRIHSQIDVLDNVVLGGTPDSLSSPLSPLAVLSGTQISPAAGLNTVWRDAIRVKRVWGEVMTPLGQLSFGRMPNHVGMGITHNDGDGIDMDFGDTVDRVMFSTEIAGFLIAPAFDWVASGLSSENLYMPLGQPFSREPSDNVEQFVLTVSKTEAPEAAAMKIANDEVVFDFGTQQRVRLQSLDSQVLGVQFDGENFNRQNDIENQATRARFVERDATIYSYNYWMTLKYQKFTLSAEYSGVIGRIQNAGQLADGETFQPSRDPTGRAVAPLDLNQHGGALRGRYTLLDDALTLELLVLAASGDSAPGFGVFPLLGAGGVAGQWDGNQAPGDDRSITNFRFHPDFIIDMIFWRQLVGLVTDALVIRPSVQYDLTSELGGRLDVIYSRSWFGSSTPSGSLPGGEELGGPDENLGVETNVSVFYRTELGFQARLQYGLFVPMNGLSRLIEIEDGATGIAQERRDPEIAHAFRLLMAIRF